MSRMQTTEVLLRWKYVRQAVGWAFYTLAWLSQECLANTLLQDEESA